MAVTLIDNWQNYGRSTAAADCVVTTYQGAKYNSNAFNYFSDTFAAGDTIELGYALRFWGIRFTVGTAIVADAVTFIWEYYIGTGWSTLKVTNPNALLSTGVQDVMFTLPSNFQGVTGAVPKIIVRIVSVTNPTEGGAQSGDYIKWSEKAYQVTGASQSYSGIYTQEKLDTYTILPSTTPTTGITSILTMPTLEMLSSARLSLVIADSTDIGAGDTVTLTGTDEWGSALTESIDVSGGNATYTSVGSYQTLTQVDCNGFTDGTIIVKTKRACMIDRKGELTWVTIGHIYIGDGSTTTSMVQNMAHIEYMAQCSFRVMNAATYGHGNTLTVGGVLHGRGGGSIFMRRKYQDSMTYQIKFVDAGGTFNFYGGVFQVYTAGYNTSYIAFTAGTVDIKDALFTGYGSSVGMPIYFSGITLTVIRALFASGSNIFAQSITNPSFTDVLHPGLFYWYHATVNPNGSVVTGGEIGSMQNQVSNAAQRIDLRNIKNMTTSKMTWGYTGASTVSEAQRISWTFDLTVNDVNGTAISGATVKIVNVLGTTIATLSTDGSGLITQQSLKQSTRDLLVGVVQSWVTHTPHTVTITKSGYQKKVIKYNMTEQREEIEVLERSGIQIDQESL